MILNSYNYYKNTIDSQNSFVICKPLIHIFQHRPFSHWAVIGLHDYIHDFIDNPIWMYSRTRFLFSLLRILRRSIVSILSGQHFPVALGELMPSFCRFSDTKLPSFFTKYASMIIYSYYIQ